MRTLSTALQNAINAGNPQRVLIVFSGGDEMTNEDIAVSAGVNLREEYNADTNLTIGDCPSSVLTFTALNDHGQLDNFQFGWFSAYLGARIDSGTPTETVQRTYTENGQSALYAFDQIGIFYAERPAITSQKTIAITAYDRMTILDVDMPSSASLGITYPTTIGNILQKICNAFPVLLDSSNFLNNDLEVTAEPEEFADATMRDVVGWIAECACSTARFTRDGKLKLCWLTSTSSSYDEHDYSSEAHTWYGTQRINNLCVRDMKNGTETYHGSGTNCYLILDNPFLRG